ncbi:hypothetical protein K437DRAFT_257668 [Tilletiaria anomala UBC 951]|uniref:GYF domain-containing protein n=1 Tax=Tilletiaria anomala (strain ATCC 24038 / CBS 436.72 / UBC 951) TaxID=1037660 RepID=A0A066VW10_TILAU|nr:uncharacterized protein K437DRAFT_257668 [Tilletiaria anomala UBC 951]KDN42999.1 hypothetical protein K437DRAFT_257668 [Tilletiaria anomala UBC 951]
MAPKRRADGPPSSSAHAPSTSNTFSNVGPSSDVSKRLRFATKTATSKGVSGLELDAPRTAAHYDRGLPQARVSQDVEDYTGDIELEEQDRKREQQGRKGRIITKMSDSESEDEDDGGGSGNAAVDDGDDDMFAADEDKSKEDASGRKKGNNYLKLGDIEGQEFGKRTRAPDKEKADLEAEAAESDDDIQDLDPDFELESSEGEENSDSEDDSGDGDGEEDKKGVEGSGSQTKIETPVAGADEPIVRLKKQSKMKLKKGMGYKIESFNMKAEMEAGRFDDEGNYIANAKDPHAEHDSWLQGNYTRKAIKAAKDAQRKRDAEERSKALKEQEMALSLPELQQRLVEHMQRGESVLETLQRLGKEAKKHKLTNKNKQSWRKNKSNGKGKEKEKAEESSAAMDTDEQRPSIAVLQAFEDVTAYSSSLMSEHGLINIYDDTYEGLLRAVKRSGKVPSDWDPASQRQEQVSGEAVDGAGPSVGDSSASLIGIPGQASTGDDARKFRYRWAPSYLAETAEASGQHVNPEIEMFGPFPLSDLKVWSQQGYFGSANERILLQETGGEGWKNWAETLGHS